MQTDLETIRDKATRLRLSPSRLARLAGLNKSSLAKLYRPEWNPKASTIAACLQAIAKEEAK